MSLSIPKEDTVLDIAFSRRAARQCAAAGLADWAACEAVANGSRRRLARIPAGGRPLLRFVRILPLGPSGRPARVAVTAEPRRRGFLAVGVRVTEAGSGGKRARRGAVPE
ncbi:MAG TPA: hypothetical protein VGG34_03715 [Opitutaceae bacterium]